MIRRLVRWLIGRHRRNNHDESTDEETGHPPGMVSDGGQTVQTSPQENGPETATQTDPGPDPTAEFPLDFHAILDHIGTPLFVLDTEGSVVNWNTAATELTGETEADAKAKGQVSEAFYHDGRRAQTLADKVLDAPETADEKFGVPTVDSVEYTLYRDTSTMLDAAGERRHISFSAAPLYEDGDLVGVVEMVQDRTEEVLRNRRTAALLETVEETMDEIRHGDLGARADFESDEYVDEELMSVLTSLNDMGEQLEELVADISARTADLHDATETVAESAQEIDDLAASQSESTADVAGEISNLSATIEEVASSADNVAETSQHARDRADEGRTLATEIETVMEEVAQASSQVRSDFDTLQETVQEIDAVLAVIDDIADQTNLLALNANIEAARAKTGGSGFAVVANEIKDLAEESKAQAAEIESLVEDVQAGTSETVESLEETEERIQNGVEEVDRAMDTLDDIADAVEEAVAGVEEVSTVTDEQAASAEEIAAMVDDAQEKAHTVAAEVSDVAAATEEQTQQVAEIDDAIADLAGRSDRHQ